MLLYNSIVFLPFLGFLFSGILGKRLGGSLAGIVSSGLVVLAAFLSIWLFFMTNIRGNSGTIFTLLPWVTSGSLSFDWSLRFDNLSVLMLVVVNVISALVHIYSISYMNKDASVERFFAYLSLFTFSMLMLVTANNLLQLFFGWEAVGLVSYLLIGYWYEKEAATLAAFKAFVVNRIGDFGFLLGIIGIFVIFSTVNFDDIFIKSSSYFDSHLSSYSIFNLAISKQLMIDIVCFCLFLGAMGKSAQLFLHVWLPDAMEGPTPVSALLHAATMVVAGVFMVARLAPVFSLSPNILIFILFIGSVTAIFAATIAIVQNDIKRIIAYSTCSQLGYMFAALGVGAFSAGMFHLFTHAFFKALLFLGAGSVIHALSGQQDIRKMGALYKILPFTYICMLIATLSSVGVGIPGTHYGLSGFLSKDSIIMSVFLVDNSIAFIAGLLLILATFFTSFYSWRLMFLTFHGRKKLVSGKEKKLHDCDFLMKIVLFILTLATLFVGMIFQPYFIGHLSTIFWGDSLTNVTASVPEVSNLFWVEILVALSVWLGFISSFIIYIIYPQLVNIITDKFNVIYKILLNGWYFDCLYRCLFVNSIVKLSFFLQNIDKKINFWGPKNISLLVIKFTNKVSEWQRGYIYHYAFVMVISITLFIGWLILGNIK
ncbi:NADH-quinone oxidoreductase subunit L [Bartonella sp. DGB1]|uniref:NADH-quinone oxidoreductase subunit L n=1 Tax=Bartonella sp. DGB1 TaxID=3239807 RepID=UPI0035236FB1